MSSKERATPITTENISRQRDQPRCISLAEARRRAFEASDKARQAQDVYAEEEARRWYDYKVEE